MFSLFFRLSPNVTVVIALLKELIDRHILCCGDDLNFTAQRLFHAISHLTQFVCVCGVGGGGGRVIRAFSDVEKPFFIFWFGR